jgi:hypothetical protein
MKTTTSEPTLAALVAIDWADQKHDIALQPAGASGPTSRACAASDPRPCAPSFTRTTFAVPSDWSSASWP